MGCLNDENGGAPDAGPAPAADAGIDAAKDATLPDAGEDASAEDAGGDALSADAPSDASTTDAGGPFVNCDPKTAVDQTGGVNGAQFVRAAAFGDKQVALWLLAFQVSPDGQTHINARPSSAGAWGSVIDLGVGNFYPSPFLVADGAGRAFAQYTTGTATVRSVYDFASQAFAAPSTFAGSAATGGGSDSALVALPAGGALSLYTTYAPSAALVADVWNPSSGKWEATSLNVPGTPNQLDVAVNPQSRKVGYVYYDYNNSTFVLHVGAYDGATWVTDTLIPAQEAGAPGSFSVGTYANGDLLVAYSSTADNALVATRYHVAGKTWDPPVILDPGGGYATSVHVAVDGSDRATVVWQRCAADGFAVRNLGSAWAAPKDLGLPAAGASGYRLALDAASNAYILTAEASSGNLVLWRAPAASDTFAAPYSTGLSAMSGGLSSNISMDRGTALTFDGAGHPLVFAALIPAAKDGGIGLSLYATKCH